MGLRDKASKAAKKAKRAVTSDGPQISQVGDQYIVFDSNNNQYGPYDDRKQAAGKVRELKRNTSGDIQDRASSFASAVDDSLAGVAEQTREQQGLDGDGDAGGPQLPGGGFMGPVDENDDQPNPAFGGGFFDGPDERDGAEVPGTGGLFEASEEGDEEMPPFMMGMDEGDRDDDEEPPWMF